MNTTKSLLAFRNTFRQAFRTQHAPFTLPHERAVRAFSIPAFRKQQPHTKTIASSKRQQSTDAETTQRPLTDRSSSTPSDTAQNVSAADEIAMRKALSPAYQLWFTCKKCLERSGHTISKQAYHFGTCVINCPKCKSQHLISDNLKIFSDTNMTMEDIAREHGEKLRKGKLGADGDIEFYDEEATAKVMEGEMPEKSLDKSVRRRRELERTREAKARKSGEEGSEAKGED